MKTYIKLDRIRRVLILTHVTTTGYTGTLTLPFSESSAAIGTETVFDPHNIQIRHEEFFMNLLGEGDLEPYLIGMTRSAERKVS